MKSWFFSSFIDCRAITDYTGEFESKFWNDLRVCSCPWAYKSSLSICLNTTLYSRTWKTAIVSKCQTVQSAFIVFPLRKCSLYNWALFFGIPLAGWLLIYHWEPQMLHKEKDFHWGVALSTLSRISCFLECESPTNYTKRKSHPNIRRTVILARLSHFILERLKQRRSANFPMTVVYTYSPGLTQQNNVILLPINWSGYSSAL